ncbi:MAG: hypothetical protein CSA18_02305 [Deltaproteobacteria bacterium]|nr:MAG: hypothetical protein CSB21_01160 [Deltaproteobacteria bacterium]PIE74963.1 MAG: hypothetical protein CSA18_02305 [Deltaproteobacteria bacterium]
MEIIQNKYKITGFLARIPGFTDYNAVNINNMEDLIVRKYEKPLTQKEFNEKKKQIQNFTKNPVENTAIITDCIYNSKNFEIITAIKKPDGSSLSSLLNSENNKTKNILFSSTLEFLYFARQMTDLLKNIHKKNIVYLNIHPESIFIDGDKKITALPPSFTSSSTIDIKTISKEEKFFGNYIYYLSPEQLTDYNEKIDLRADLYSLGVIFYQCITGTLPFEDLKDINAFFNALISKNTLVSPPPEIFFPVYQIISKLMAKSKSKRYQSIYGLSYDLQRCMEIYENKNEISSFTPGTRDISVKFNISKKIYGRDVEQSKLLISYYKTVKGYKKNIFIKGDAGIGKTRLILEFKNNVKEAGGTIISGRFLEKDIKKPYTAFKQAFSRFLNEIIAKGEESVKFFRELFIAHFGDNCHIINKILPEINLITENFFENHEKDVKNNKNIFFTECRKFLEVCISFSKSLVLFLDDLDMADEESLELLSLISKYFQGGPLLIIGTYKNEDNQSIKYIEEITSHMKDNDMAFQVIELEALSTQHITELIYDSFGSEPVENVEFANLIFQQTEGNPLQIHQYLFSLYHSNLIYYDSGSEMWKWDINSTHTKNRQLFSKNHIIQILNSFTLETLKILEFAACSGSKFSASTLCIILDMEKDELNIKLSPCFSSGFIFRPATGEDIKNDCLYFRHENIQKTILASISHQETKKHHLYIGQKLYFHFKDNDPEKLHEIVYHLNKGAELLDDKEKYNLAKLNIDIAENIVKSGPGSTASSFLEKSEELLGNNKWEDFPELSTLIYLETGFWALASWNYEKAIKNAEKILLNNKDIESRVKAYELIIKTYIAKNKLGKAIELGLFILKELGFKINKKPLRFKIFSELIKTKILLTPNPVKKISSLPEMNDKKILLAMRILSNLISPSYLAFPALHPIISSMMTRLSLKYGCCPETSYGLASFGISLCSLLKDYSSGYEIGKASLAISKKNKFFHKDSKALMVYAVFLKHWKSPLNSCIPLLKKARDEVIKTGDFEFAAYGLHAILSYSIFAGHPVSKIKKEIEISEKNITQMGQKTVLNYIRLFMGFTKIILKESELRPIKPEKFSSNPLNKKTPRQNITFNFLINFLNYLIFFYANNISEADIYWKKADRYAHSAASLAAYPCHLFFGAVISILKYDKKKSLPEIKCFQKIAYSSPENHFHRYLFIEAELSRISGNTDKAEYYYQKAINLSIEKNFIQDTAYFNERACLFFKENKKYKTAYNYLKASTSAYKKWGCILKVSEMISLKNTFPDSEIMFFKEEAVSLKLFPDIFRLLRLLSEKRNKNEMILQLMDILIEISGGTHGYFIALYENIPFVKASVTSNTVPEYYEPGSGLSSFEEILEPVVHNVFQTKQIFYPQQISKKYSNVLTTDDEKIPKSLICLPIIKEHDLKGVIYLEHTDIKNVFTQDKVEMLTIIAAHTAICLENIEIYSTLTEKIGSKNKSENIIHETQNKLEKKIEQKTRDLISINEKLQKEAEFKLQAEKALIESETKYKILVERMNDGLGVQDKNGIITYVNERMCEITGYKNNELVGVKAKEIIKKLVDNPQEFFRKSSYTNIIFEQTIIKKDKKKVIVLFQGERLYDIDSNYEGSFSVITDITPLKEMAAAVEQREEQISALLNATTDSVMMIDTKGTILTANNSSAKRFECSMSEFIGSMVFDFFPTKFINDNKHYINKIINSGEIIRFQEKIKNYFFEITLYPVVDNFKKIDRIAVYAKDITELKNAEKQIKTLTRQIIKAQENERQKIALDLHDHVAQNLSFLKIETDSLKNLKENKLHEKISTISAGLKGSIEDIRHISYNLRPPNLHELGLAKAIYQHCEEFSEKYRIDIDFTSAGIENLNLSFDAEINIFRIIQEALTNIYKHSMSENARIRLIASYPEIILRIEDNGCGFSADSDTSPEISGTKMGIKGMKERIKLIGGAIEIITKHGSGTKIIAKIPYPELKNL